MRRKEKNEPETAKKHLKTTKKPSKSPSFKIGIPTSLNQWLYSVAMARKNELIEHSTFSIVGKELNPE